MSEPKLSFSKVFWPSLVAVIIASFISIIAFFIITGVLFSSLFNFKPSFEIKENSILQVKLNGEINDNQRSTFDVASLDILENSSLSSLIYGIETAKADPKIKGLFIDIGNLSCGYSTAHALRSAIIDFQNS